LIASGFVVLSLLLLPLVAGQSNGLPSTNGSAADEVTVEGRVVDNQGAPVAKADVSFYPYSAHTGPLPAAVTAADGTFVLHMQPLGEGAVTAWKVDAGFPNAAMALYGKGYPSERKINATVAASPIHVDLSFEAPDAVLDWKILSKVDRSPVRSVRYSVAWSDDPKAFIRGATSDTGVFRFVLPKRPVVLTVGAPGFRDWTSADSREFGGAVQFAPGTRDERTILLEPAEQAAPVTDR
jgi:hypothetical protein